LRETRVDQSLPNDYNGAYVNLNDAPQSADKEHVFLNKVQSGQIFRASPSTFAAIPGSPIAYWVSERMRGCFRDGGKLGDIATPRQGMRTGDNSRFLRLWWENGSDKVGIRFVRLQPASSNRKWFPYNKGGDFRKWYGNHDLVVNWESDGHEIKSLTRETYPDLGDNLSWKITNEGFYFRDGITWGGLTSSDVSFRYSDVGALFDSNKGAMLFPEEAISKAMLAFLNSVIAKQCLKILNPTLSTQNRDIENLPFDVERLAASLNAISPLAQSAVEIARETLVNASFTQVEQSNFADRWISG